MCGAPTRGAEPGTREGQTNNMANRRRSRQANSRRPYAKKDSPRCTRSATVAKVHGDRLSNFGWQRDMFHHLPLAMHDEFPRTPSDVAELECDDLSGAQTEPRQQ